MIHHIYFSHASMVASAFPKTSEYLPNIRVARKKKNTEVQNLNVKIATRIKSGRSPNYLFTNF